MIVDAHQHFWDPARGDYGWLVPGSPICRPFGPQDLRPLMDACGVEACILVQAAPTAAESDYLLAIARETPWVLGVVGWIDLMAPDAAGEVRHRAADPHFLGVRPMLQDMDDPDWILSTRLAPALGAIASAGLVFDALIRTHQTGAIAEIAVRYPQLCVVLDHAAKPRLGNSQAMAAWRTALRPLAARPNVVCKLSGLWTELAPGGDPRHLRDAIGILFDLFGPRRLLWGSDWPVLTLAAGYVPWFELARDVLAARGPEAVPAVMGANALRVYRRAPA